MATLKFLYIKLGIRRLFLYVGQGFSLATVCTRNRATLKGRPTTALKFLYVKLGLRRFFIRRARLQPCDCLHTQQGNPKGSPYNGIEIPIRKLGIRQLIGIHTQGHGHRVPTLKFLYIELSQARINPCLQFYHSLCRHGFNRASPKPA